jgi:2-polyprenyl-6-methoxyphenol hydroxylase-like FAD-dependent oxidoreductase
VAAGFRWPQLSIHRGWLQQCLAEHVRARLGDAAIKTGTHVVDAKSATGDDAGVSVRYQDRDSGHEQLLDADLLIGADGIRSAVRSVIAPADPGPRATSQIVWRGMAWRPSFLDGRTMVIAGNEDHKVVFYPIAGESDRALVNWAAAGPLDPDEDAEHGNWNLPVEPQAFAPRFEGWQVEGVDVAELMLASGACFAYPMVDLDPLDRWTQGAITLIGDAAHAMYPVGSNGATQSIVDGAALAFHLAQSRSVSAGLIAFEHERLPRCRSIQESNRQQGPEVVVDLAAARVPHQYATVAEAFGPGELEAIAARYARTTALDEANADSPYRISEVDPRPTTIERQAT